MHSFLDYQPSPRLQLSGSKLRINSAFYHSGVNLPRNNGESSTPNRGVRACHGLRPDDEDWVGMDNFAERDLFLACARVCSAWLPRALVNLYHTVTLSDSSDVNGLIFPVSLPMHEKSILILH